MNKIKSFFIGSMLLIIVFIMMVMVALIYRANEQSHIKSYIFQMNNFANKRVGELQDLNEISPDDLRNKLIKKYVSEYFKVIPGETNVSKRPVLDDMSTKSVFKQWQEGEAKTIEKMSEQKMFRMIRFDNNSVSRVNTNKNDNDEKLVYYAVRYYMYTWTESNLMENQPVPTQGVIYLQIKFEPGIRETIHQKKVNIKKYLESGKSPAGLFMFTVHNVAN